MATRVSTSHSRSKIQSGVRLRPMTGRATAKRRRDAPTVAYNNAFMAACGHSPRPLGVVCSLARIGAGSDAQQSGPAAKQFWFSPS